MTETRTPSAAGVETADIDEEKKVRMDDNAGGYGAARTDTGAVRGFYAEAFFSEMLRTEIRRSERSHQSFVLILIDIKELFESLSGGRFLVGRRKRSLARRLQGILVRSTREIDIKGWFRDGEVMGVICVETDEGGRAPVLAKLGNEIRMEFTKEQLRLIRITSYVFPADRAGLGEFLDYLLERRSRPVAHALSLACKRSIDIIGSIAGLALFLPFFMVIPVLIKLTSPGPVLFRQERVGYRGRRFMLYKFRSMKIGSDPSVHREFVKKLIKGDNPNGGGDGKVYKITRDPRVTRIGAILRKTSLDELPQFFNVFKGDMSLVGPRPAIPYEVEEYALWHQRRVLETKPGITGYWQVRGRSATTFDTMVRMDIQYIRRRSLWLDLKLIIQTPFALLKGGY